MPQEWLKAVTFGVLIDFQHKRKHEYFHFTLQRAVPVLHVLRDQMLLKHSQAATLLEHEVGKDD